MRFKLCFAVLVFCSLAVLPLPVRPADCDEVDTECSTESITSSPDWPTIFGEVFEGISSKNIKEIDHILAKHMKYVREYVRPKCPTKFFSSEPRDLSRLECLIDETFLSLFSLSSRLRCSAIDCSDWESANWESLEIRVRRGSILMWLDMIPIDHGKDLTETDRNSTLSLMLGRIHDFIHGSDINGLQEFLRTTRLPSLHQMNQLINGSCITADWSWENDIACPWRNLLDEIFLLTNTYKGNTRTIIRLSSTLEKYQQLKHLDLKNVVEDATIETLEQFSENIAPLLNIRSNELSEYFSTLSEFDNSTAKNEMNYLLEKLDDFNKQQLQLNGKLQEISTSALNEEGTLTWLQLTGSAALGLLNAFSGDADALNTTYKASTAEGDREGLMERINSDLSKLFSAISRNKDLLGMAMSIVEYEANPDGSVDINDIEKRFLDTYQDYDPQVNSTDFKRFDKGLKNFMGSLRVSVNDTTNDESFVAQAELVELVHQIPTVLQSRFEFQLDLMDTLAVFVRAKLGMKSVQKLEHSIREIKNETSLGVSQLTKQQVALSMLIVSRTHTLQALQPYCNELEYRNAGIVPKVCTNAMENLSNSTLSDVLTFSPGNCIVNAPVFANIPVADEERKDGINLFDLYKRNKTTLQIPDAQWLVDNGWVNKSNTETNVFYVKGFELFLVSQEESSKEREVRVDISADGPAALHQDGGKHNRYEIKPSQRYEFRYKENTPQCNNTVANPYEICTPLSNMCILKEGLIDNEHGLYPSVFSKWVIESPGLNGDSSLLEAKHGLFLRAKVTLCSKSSSNRSEIIIQERNVSQINNGSEIIAEERNVSQINIGSEIIAEERNVSQINNGSEIIAEERNVSQINNGSEIIAEERDVSQINNGSEIMAEERNVFQINNGSEMIIQDRNVSQVSKECEEGKYLDRQTHEWKTCPQGLVPALGGHFCGPGL